MKAVQALHWRVDKLRTGIEIFFPLTGAPANSNVVFFVFQTIKFGQLLQQMTPNHQSASYPPGVTSNTNVIEFLLDFKQQRAVQFTFQNRQFALHSKACQTDIQTLRHHVNTPGGIFNDIRQFINLHSERNDSLLNDYLARYRIKLQLQAFCKLQGISVNQPLSEDLKIRFTSYLTLKNTQTAHTEDQGLLLQSWQIQMQIEGCKQKIKSLEESTERVMRLYRMSAAVVTAIHLSSFGYMIFMVDWLGWDIIEPLTYTTGVVYTLLGIRFYRKYLVDRGPSTIRFAITKAVIKPTQLREMEQVNKRIQQLQFQLREIQLRRQIAKNRLLFKSSMTDVFKNLI